MQNIAAYSSSESEGEQAENSTKKFFLFFFCVFCFCFFLNILLIVYDIILIFISQFNKFKLVLCRRRLTDTSTSKNFLILGEISDESDDNSSSDNSNDDREPQNFDELVNRRLNTKPASSSLSRGNYSTILHNPLSNSASAPKRSVLESPFARARAEEQESLERHVQLSEHDQVILLIPTHVT